MNRYVDIAIDALADLLTTMPRGDAFRVEKGLPSGAQIVDVTYIKAQGLLRLHLDQEAFPVAITRLVVEPYFKAIVKAASDHP